MKNNGELLIPDVEMPDETTPQQPVTGPDRTKHRKGDVTLDPNIVASSNTPEDIKRVVEQVSKDEVVDDKKE
ncbi:MAG TPA: hypothetical protein VI336_03150 [Candidatus Saccharimonadales bacterium]|nr:hypothetical protein [Candidatus Saccharimonadales bacterium]